MLFLLTDYNYGHVYIALYQTYMYCVTVIILLFYSPPMSSIDACCNNVIKTYFYLNDKTRIIINISY